MKNLTKKFWLLLFVCTSFQLISLAQNTFPYPASGNVGLGTASPAHQLDVRGNIGLSGNIYGRSSGGSLAIYGGTSYTNGGYLRAYTQAAGGGVSLVTGLNANTGTNGRMRFTHWTGSTWQDRMVLDGNGNLGIGTTTPSSKLHLAGKMLINVNAQTPTGFGLSINASANHPGMEVKTTHSGNYNYGVRIESNQPYTKAIAVKQSGQTEGFVMYANGRGYIKGALAIGTGSNTDPNDGKFYNLSVDGRIRANEVKVYTGWADFVFEKDYDLKSLETVEAFIQKNGHLPDVPSAQEVETNGINLGESDAILLRKIEELTLYMIEVNERIKTLETENAKLKTAAQN